MRAFQTFEEASRPPERQSADAMSANALGIKEVQTKEVQTTEEADRPPDHAELRWEGMLMRESKKWML
jgi:hypothetical protein